jgi:hypothetical protein
MTTAALLPLLALSLPVAAEAGTAPPRVLDGRSVRFEQVYWREAGGAPSGTGILTVDPARVESVTGARSGFVSVFDGRRFTVLNAPVHRDVAAHWPDRVARLGPGVPDFSAPLSVEFDLGTRRGLRSLRAVVLHTDEPLVGRAALAAAQSVLPSVHAVAPVRQTTETGVALPEPPLVLQAPWDSPALPDLPAAAGNTFSVIQPHETNVQAAQDQCTTAAVANGLFFLDSVYDIGVYHLPGRGLAPADGLMMLAWLDGLGHRPSESACVGDGMYACRLSTDEGYEPGHDRGYMDALYRYIGWFLDESQLTIAHQGGVYETYPGDCSMIPQDGPVSVREAEKPTFEWMCDRIAQGEAVLVNVIRYAVPEGGDPETDQEAQSGHMLRVYGCGASAGVPYLYMLDDGAQDGMTDEAVPMCALNDGLRWWIRGVNDTDGDGWLNVKDDLHEIEFALAIGVK